MDPVWFKTELSDEIIRNDGIYDQTNAIVEDIIQGKLCITKLVENMCGVLTNKDPERREQGMRFFTKILQDIPKSYLTEKQVSFIANFYTDRLKDNHRVIPHVIEGYLCIIEMENYLIQQCGEFFTVLFREVPCQSQLRPDRYNIYLIVQRLLESHLNHLKTLGPDFIYGFISAMDGERDPRNLMFLFSFLQRFISNITLGHLVEEMFEVISCYYPIDFNASAEDPNAVRRQDLADALAPCLCAVPEFGEPCLLLLVEKLDSSLRIAKIDSLRLLAESCKIFTAESYTPFLKTLWASLQRELSHKTDEELKFAAYEALHALVKKLSQTANTDQTFENFVKGIIICTQTALADASTSALFDQVTKILLTTANASKESCLIVVTSMIPGAVAFYEFSKALKLQIGCLQFLANLYAIVEHWNVSDKVKPQLDEIPQLFLTAVSQQNKDYQIAGFTSLARVVKILKEDLIVPFVEVLTHNVLYVQDSVLLEASIACIHAMATQFPQHIMDIFVNGKMELHAITKDKSTLQRRLNVLSKLASIDSFTKVILEAMLHIISDDDTENAEQVVDALNSSLSDSKLYSEKKIEHIENNYKIIDCIVEWLLKEIERSASQATLVNGYSLIALTMSHLTQSKQIELLSKHTETVLHQFQLEEENFLILESLYNSLRQDVYTDTFVEVLTLASQLALYSDNDLVRTKACTLLAHFLNKVEYGEPFDTLYSALKDELSTMERVGTMFHKVLTLNTWVTKCLILRGYHEFTLWLETVATAISSPEWCFHGAQSIRMIMTDDPEALNVKCHCRVNLLYRQRMFQRFLTTSEMIDVSCDRTKEAYLLSWAFILEKISKNVLFNEVEKIAPLVVQSLDFENRDLLVVMLEVLSHLVQAKQVIIGRSLQSILPRLIKLSLYPGCMYVRSRSLQCLFDIANSYPTALLLPYKTDLLLDLAPSLDDKKRLVRNAAVKARTRWFLIGSPGEDKVN